MHHGETLYLNTTIHTMDEAQPSASAMLVRDDRVAAIGTRQNVEQAAGPGAHRIDLAGSTVVPGFNDSHCHILWIGLMLQMVDVSVDAVCGIEDIKAAVRGRAETTPPAEWVVGRGYDQNMLAEGRHPNRHDLDAVSPEHPVVLRHTSGHVLTTNSLALQRAGVTRDTTDSPGGEIDRDEHGEPTGVLKESAMRLVDDVVPSPTLQEGTEAILNATREMAQYGITSASDAATGTGPSFDPTLQMYRNAAATGRLSGRITIMPQIYYVAPPDSDEVHGPDRFDAGNTPLWLTIGATKIFSDGALSTRTCAVRTPYVDTGGYGILLWPDETLRSMIHRAHGAGWSIATHALGDRAVEVVVDAYERALADTPRKNHRHRIEHCMIADELLGRRIRDAGILPSLQPDIFRLGDGYVAALGVERASATIPAGMFRRLGVRVAFSSDAPVIPSNPFPIIQSAAQRTTPGGVSLGLDEAVSVEEAIRNYTAGGAYATHTERDKGALTPGTLADFAVLARDPLQLPLDELDTVQVTLTVVGGTEMFRA